VTARWVNPAQASEHTGWSTDTIGDALRSGELRGHQRTPGGRWRIAIEDLDAWMRGEKADVEIPIVTRRRAS
jgi:excisionase family DNA binding protein